MSNKIEDEAQKTRSIRGTVITGFTFALTLAISAYFLINFSKSNNVAFGSVWFLVFLPAYLCAIICYVADPNGDKPPIFYWSVPLIFTSTVVLGSFFFLQEGVICLVMLSPLWLAFGGLGAFIMHRQLRRPRNPNILHSTLVFLPLLSGGIESQIPISHDHISLSREIIIHATPQEIWPYTISNAYIKDDEGRWTFTQNVLGLPRPRATILSGEGKGAVRTAFWGDQINFDEKITQWQPGRLLSWSFSFPNRSLQKHTDKHISPDGQFLKINSGNYKLTPLTPETTLVSLRTNYVAKTHVNSYAAFWGEILLGDIHNNVLAIIKQRAEINHSRNTK
jgi:hypothetical protein